MKYISLILLIGLMIWSWSLATAQQSFTLENHQQVEARVEEDVRGFIIRKYPNTSDIYCQQLYTEVVKPNEAMTVHFRCRTEGSGNEGEKIQQTFEGHISIASTDGFQSWNETGGEIRSPEVLFQNGSRISAKDPMPQGADEPEAAAKPAAPAREGEHAH